MSDISTQIAKRIRSLRTAQGLTLAMLADRSGMPVETLSRIERQRMAPSISSLSRVATGLGVPLVALLSDEAVPVVAAEGIPAAARGIALALAGQPPGVIEQVRRIVDILVERPEVE